MTRSSAALFAPSGGRNEKPRGKSGDLRSPLPVATPVAYGSGTTTGRATTGGRRGTTVVRRSPATRSRLPPSVPFHPFPKPWSSTLDPYASTPRAMPMLAVSRRPVIGLNQPRAVAPSLSTRHSSIPAGGPFISVQVLLSYAAFWPPAGPQAGRLAGKSICQHSWMGSVSPSSFRAISC